ncbi:MAG: glycosyltransferase family 4 protein [Terracidiphilus sp.]
MVAFSFYPADPRIRRAAEALLAEGMNMDLICEGQEGIPSRESRDHLEIIRVPVRRHRGGALSYAYQYFSFIMIASAVLAWRMLRGRYDLVYVHNMPDILVVSGILPRLFGAKVILDQHDPMPELMMTIFNRGESSLGVRVIRRLERWSFACADSVITVNEACKKIFSARSCRADKISVVMNSPDGEIFPYRSARSYIPRASGQRFVIMYHGSLVERNGLELAVDALAQAQQKIQDAELRIFGADAPYLQRVMEKVSRLGLDNHVRYLGPRKLEDLAHEIESCDVGVIPNQRNIFTDINTPTRIFEYLALGKPVIAPSTRGITDYFGHDSLFFFESGNAQDLAMRMEDAADHPAETVDIAERGQQIYLAHTWSQERQGLVNQVRRLLSKSKLH